LLRLIALSIAKMMEMAEGNVWTRLQLSSMQKAWNFMSSAKGFMPTN